MGRDPHDVNGGDTSDADLFDWDDEAPEEVEDAPGEPADVPAGFEFLAEAAPEFYHPGWHLGQYARWAAELDEGRVARLVDLRRRVRELGRDEDLGRWLAERMVWGARRRDRGDDVCYQVDRVVHLWGMLAARDVEPLASDPSVDRWERVEWTGQPGRCQATRSDPIECAVPSHDPGRPYLLCHAAADRLIYRSLRPVEWFRLAALHGTGEYYLWADFYGRRGQAYQKLIWIDPSPEFRTPRLKDVRGKLDDLLDLYLVTAASDPPAGELREVREALLAFPHERIGKVLGQRNGLPADDALKLLGFDTAVEALGEHAPDWVRRWWQKVGLTDDGHVSDVEDLAAASARVLGAFETVNLLMEALDRLGWPRADQPPAHYALASGLVFRLMDRMGADVLLELALELIARVPPEHRPGEVLHALSRFNDPGVLNWMEKHAAEPLTHEWGTVAAVNGIDWPRAERWLARGHPLGRVALDALAACRPYDPETMSGVLRDRRLKIAGAPSPRAVQMALERYTVKDGSKAVRETVDTILRNLERIVQ